MTTLYIICIQKPKFESQPFFSEENTLIFITGGILCAASICYKDDSLVVAYLDGSLRIWNLADGSFGLNLKEKYTSDEDIITGICSHLHLSKKLCVATFQNGKI